MPVRCNGIENTLGKASSDTLVEVLNNRGWMKGGCSFWLLEVERVTSNGGRKELGWWPPLHFNVVERL
jgi:hypothetical protein